MNMPQWISKSEHFIEVGAGGTGLVNWVFTDVYQSDMIIYVWNRPLTSTSERLD